MVLFFLICMNVSIDHFILLFQLPPPPEEINQSNENVELPPTPEEINKSTERSSFSNRKKIHGRKYRVKIGNQRKELVEKEKLSRKLKVLCQIQPATMK